MLICNRNTNNNIICFLPLLPSPSLKVSNMLKQKPSTQTPFFPLFCVTASSKTGTVRVPSWHFLLRGAGQVAELEPARVEPMAQAGNLNQVPDVLTTFSTVAFG